MPTLISTALKSYRKNKRSLGLSEDTIERVILNTSMFSRDMNIERVGEITTEKIIDWGESKLTSGNISHSTLYTYYNSLRSFLNFVRSLGYMHDVDYERIRCRPRYKEKLILMPGQIRRVIKLSNPQTAILIRLMYTSGMRISEAVSITDKHLTDGIVLHIVGKGSKARPVMVTQELLLQLRTLAELNGGPCFIDQNGEQLSRKKAYYRIKKVMERAGYPFAHPHTLRHSYCTELLRKGVDLTRVSKMMGHASIAVTQIYTHLVTDDIVKAHKLLTRV